MGKGSAPRPFTDREVFESNFDKIFRSKKNSDDVSPHTYEYELNKSTGEVEKKYSHLMFVLQIIGVMLPIGIALIIILWVADKVLK